MAEGSTFYPFMTDSTLPIAPVGLATQIVDNVLVVRVTHTDSGRKGVIFKLTFVFDA